MGEWRILLLCLRAAFNCLFILAPCSAALLFHTRDKKTLKPSHGISKNFYLIHNFKMQLMTMSPNLFLYHHPLSNYIKICISFLSFSLPPHLSAVSVCCLSDGYGSWFRRWETGSISRLSAYSSWVVTLTVTVWSECLFRNVVLRYYKLLCGCLKTTYDSVAPGYGGVRVYAKRGYVGI